MKRQPSQRRTQRTRPWLSGAGECEGIAVGAVADDERNLSDNMYSGRHLGELNKKEKANTSCGKTRRGRTAPCFGLSRASYRRSFPLQHHR